MIDVEKNGIVLSINEATLDAHLKKGFAIAGGTKTKPANQLKKLKLENTKIKEDLDKANLKIAELEKALTKTNNPPKQLTIDEMKAKLKEKKIEFDENINDDSLIAFYQKSFEAEQ